MASTLLEAIQSMKPDDCEQLQSSDCLPSNPGRGATAAAYFRQSGAVGAKSHGPRIFKLAVMLERPRADPNAAVFYTRVLR